MLFLCLTFFLQYRGQSLETRAILKIEAISKSEYLRPRYRVCFWFREQLSIYLPKAIGIGFCILDVGIYAWKFKETLLCIP